MRCAFLLVCAALAALAQSGTDPKPKAVDYEVHALSKDAQSKDVALGAEFMIHSFSGRGLTYIADDYLVVEVALYPPKGESIQADPGRFNLRLNGKKQLLLPVQPQMVAAALQHPDWRTGPRLEGGGGLGNTGVIFGRPRTTPPIPGAPQPGRSPMPPRAPAPDSPGGIEREPVMPAHELVVETALPSGAFRGPVSGFIYFPFKGKVSSIKSLDLLYEDVVMKLR